MLFLALVLCALLLLVLDQAGMLGPLRTRATSLLSPALTVIHRIGGTLDSLTQNIGSTGQLNSELEALREENSRLKAENIRVEALELEIARLRQQVRIEAEQPWKLFGADVSAYTPDTGRRVLLLAAGSNDGIKPGMAVIAKEGSNPPSLIGVVEETGPNSASVLLITDFSSAVSARIYREDQMIDGVVQGQWQRGSRLLLDEIERDKKLAAGDVVFTAGLSAEFDTSLPHAAIPRDVPIGIVEEIITAGHSEQASLRPYVDPDRVRYAWVILSADD